MELDDILHNTLGVLASTLLRLGYVKIWKILAKFVIFHS